MCWKGMKVSIGTYGYMERNNLLFSISYVQRLNGMLIIVEFWKRNNINLHDHYVVESVINALQIHLSALKDKQIKAIGLWICILFRYLYLGCRFFNIFILSLWGTNTLYVLKYIRYPTIFRSYSTGYITQVCQYTSGIL